MHTENIMFYSFAELKKEVQDKIIKQCQEDGIYMPDDWYQEVFDMFKERMMANLRFAVDNIQFTGFWSQGDGASFTGEFEDIPYVIDMWMGNEKGYDLDFLKEAITSIEITRISSRYSHQYTVIANVEGWDEERQDEVEKACLLLEKKIEEWKNMTCTMLYRELEEWYENYNNEDFIRSCLMDEDDEDYLADGTYMV